MRKEKAGDGMGGPAVLAGGDAVWGLGRAQGCSQTWPTPCSLSCFVKRREEKRLKKRLLENKTDEEISSLLSASLQGETLNAGPRRPVGGGAACVQPLGREHFWAGFPSMRCPDVLLRARQDGADLLHLYRPSVG